MDGKEDFFDTVDVDAYTTQRLVFTAIWPFASVLGFFPWPPPSSLGNDISD